MPGDAFCLTTQMTETKRRNSFMFGAIMVPKEIV